MADKTDKTNKAEGKFLLVSLDESAAKSLATVLSNDTARKILNYLSESSATESHIAKELQLPLSTVHYNIGILAKANLIESPEYHYSSKGQEVNHWSVSSKYIILAPKNMPKDTEKLSKLLKKALFSIASVAAIGAVIDAYLKSRLTLSDAFTSTASSSAPLESSQKAMIAAKSSEAMAQQAASGGGFWPYYLLGAVLVILFYFLFDYLLEKR